jgi:hypothetical protein
MQPIQVQFDELDDPQTVWSLGKNYAVLLRNNNTGKEGLDLSQYALKKHG